MHRKINARTICPMNSSKFCTKYTIMGVIVFLMVLLLFRKGELQVDNCAVDVKNDASGVKNGASGIEESGRQAVRSLVGKTHERLQKALPCQNG
jgi:hypothetical protein